MLRAVLQQSHVTDQQELFLFPGTNSVCIKCLFLDDEMCTLQKVGGEDSIGRRVL